MSEKYTFEFSGTKEDFLNKLGWFPHNSEQFYYFHDYIVKITNDKIQFGVERAGHSGGYWFIPTITECDDKIQFSGIIEYIPPDDKSIAIPKSAFKRIIEKIGMALWFVLLLPFLLVVFFVVGVCELFKWSIGKLKRNTKTKAKSTEEKLFDLMENYLDCVRI